MPNFICTYCIDPHWIIKLGSRFHQHFMCSFYTCRSQKGKKYSQAISLFCTFWICKCKMLVKSTLGKVIKASQSTTIIALQQKLSFWPQVFWQWVITGYFFYLFCFWPIIKFEVSTLCFLGTIIMFFSSFF